MKSSDALVKIRGRLMKPSGNANPNILNESVQEVVNKVVNQITRNTIKNEGEKTKIKISDFNFLIKEEKLGGKNLKLYFESVAIPTDFFEHVELTPIVSKGECKKVIPSNLLENASSNSLLNNWSSQPSFDFEQSFHTVFGKRIRQYHNEDFIVDNLLLKYYRKPKVIKFPNTFQSDGTSGTDDTWEWKDDLAEIIIDAAVNILAADTNNVGVFETTQQRVNRDI